MKLPSLTRRELLKNSFAGVAGLVASKTAIGALGEACGLTPVQDTGPFPPTPDQLSQQQDQDWDLTLMKGHTQAASGQIVEILGQVRGEACQGIPNATLEVWQACTSGKYNHPADQSITWKILTSSISAGPRPTVRAIIEFVP